MAKITDTSYPEVTAPALGDILLLVDDPAGTPAVSRLSLSNLLKVVYPVGSIYCTTTNTNPATTLGFGTWEVYAAGRVLVGIDSGDTDFDTIGETRGAKTHTLTTAEMPSHTHIQDAHQHTLAEGTTDGSGTFMDRSNAAAATTAATDAATAVNQSTGGGGAHNNIQPSQVVAMFRRTA